MLGLLVSLIVGAAAGAGVGGAFDPLSGMIVGPLLSIGVWILLGRVLRKRLEPLMQKVEAHIQGQRFEPALALLESARRLGRWQPFLSGAIDAQIGGLRYAALNDPEGARPALERAGARHWHAAAMLAAGHFRKERYAEMERTFERALKRNRKQGLLYSAYAWCQWRRGQRDAALRILARGRAALPADVRLRNQTAAIENGRRPKMSGYGPEWFALRLERAAGPGGPQPGGRPRYTPPIQAMGVRGGFRVRPSRA